MFHKDVTNSQLTSLSVFWAWDIVTTSWLVTVPEYQLCSWENADCDCLDMEDFPLIRAVLLCFTLQFYYWSSVSHLAAHLTGQTSLLQLHGLHVVVEGGHEALAVFTILQLQVHMNDEH